MVEFVPDGGNATVCADVVLDGETSLLRVAEQAFCPRRSGVLVRIGSLSLDLSAFAWMIGAPVEVCESSDLTPLALR